MKLVTLKLHVLLQRVVVFILFCFVFLILYFFYLTWIKKCTWFSKNSKYLVKSSYKHLLCLPSLKAPLISHGSLLFLSGLSISQSMPRALSFKDARRKGAPFRERTCLPHTDRNTAQPHLHCKQAEEQKCSKGCKSKCPWSSSGS